MNETLESMARAIFKSWFVDFDPVRAKADGRQPAGMDAETAALFPASFSSVDEVQIPIGWEPATVNDRAEIVKEQIAPYEHPFQLFEHYSLPAFDSGRVP